MGRKASHFWISHGEGVVRERSDSRTASAWFGFYPCWYEHMQSAWPITSPQYKTAPSWRLFGISFYLTKQKQSIRVPLVHVRSESPKAGFEAARCSSTLCWVAVLRSLWLAQICSECPAAKQPPPMTSGESGLQDPRVLNGIAMGQEWRQGHFSSLYLEHSGVFSVSPSITYYPFSTGFQGHNKATIWPVCHKAGAVNLLRVFLFFHVFEYSFFLKKITKRFYILSTFHRQHLMPYIYVNSPILKLPTTTTPYWIAATGSVLPGLSRSAWLQTMASQPPLPAALLQIHVRSLLMMREGKVE